jgi:hypothetical protein
MTLQFLHSFSPRPEMIVQYGHGVCSEYFPHLLQNGILPPTLLLRLRSSTGWTE